MDEIISLTKDLMKFKSTHSRPEEIKGCIEHIEAFLGRNNIDFTRMTCNDYPSILVFPHNRRAPVTLITHIDVVEAPDEIFTPVERDGKLYGRGSIDDKYAVALSLILLKRHLGRLGSRNTGQGGLSFGVLITADEEIGGFNGTRQALEQIKTDFGVVLDGGSVNEVVVKAKGILKLRLVSRGQAAHGSRPWLGINAIDSLIEDYARIKNHFNQGKSGQWGRTINLGSINAGSSFNQVPDRAEAVFDIRYTENDDVDRLIQDLQQEIKGELTVEMREPLFLAGKSPYLDLLLNIAGTAKETFEHGASDARFLSARGIKGVVWGANGDLSQHSMDEHVNLDSIKTIYQILDVYLSKVDDKVR